MPLKGKKCNFKEMTIEMHTPRVGLHEAIVQRAQQAMLRLRQMHKAIVHLHCILREDASVPSSDNKICEIKVEVDGEYLFTHSRTSDYATAAEEAMRHMFQQLSQLVARQHNLPDHITTTVKV